MQTMQTDKPEWETLPDSILWGLERVDPKEAAMAVDLDHAVILQDTARIVWETHGVRMSGDATEPRLVTETHDKHESPEDIMAATLSHVPSRTSFGVATHFASAHFASTPSTSTDCASTPSSSRSCIAKRRYGRRLLK